MRILLPLNILLLFLSILEAKDQRNSSSKGGFLVVDPISVFKYCHV